MTDLREVLIARLVADEGIMLSVYDDATGTAIKPGSHVVGHPSVGIGRALDTRGITPDEARYLLGNDVDVVTVDLDKQLPWWRSMTLNRQVVLASMRFQLGMAGLLGFKNTLAKMKAGDYSGAAAGMLASKWATQTPARAKRLSQMMEAG